MADNSHLCGACRRVMCRDCKAIADEYPALLQRYKAALHKAEQALEQARQELTIARQSRDDYARVLKLGVQPQMLAWIESLTPAQFRQAVERAAQDHGSNGGTQ